MTIPSNTPREAKDRWRTPPWLFAWVCRRYGRPDVDLAAESDNTLCDAYPIDAFAQPWITLGRLGWCNPPYSDPAAWLERAVEESLNGFTSILLVPAPNGEVYHARHTFGTASEIVFIAGRVSFLRPDGTPGAQNRQGSMIAIYRAHDLGATRYRCVTRDRMIADYIDGASE